MPETLICVLVETIAPGYRCDLVEDLRVQDVFPPESRPVAVRPPAGSGEGQL